MGFIEEGRQLIQDFVTPEIRTIDARLTAVEKRLDSIDSKIEKNQAQLEKRMDSLDVKVDRVQTAVESKMDRNHALVMDALHNVERYN
jgi:tetrahydromethanopterin S-methyltransferase subunit G